MRKLRGFMLSMTVLLWLKDVAFGDDMFEKIPKNYLEDTNLNYAMTYEDNTATSLLVRASKHKVEKGESFQIKFDATSLADTNKIMYVSTSKEKSNGNFVKIKYLSESSATKQITLNDYSKDFQRALSNEELKSLSEYRYILFSNGNLDVDSFAKSGIELKETIAANPNDVELLNRPKSPEPALAKYYELSINSKSFPHSEFQKALSLADVSIHLADALKHASVENIRPIQLDTTNTFVKKFLSILTHEVLETKNHQILDSTNKPKTIAETKLSKQFLTNNPPLSRLAQRIREHLFPGIQNVAEIQSGTNVLIDKPFLLADSVIQENIAHQGQKLPAEPPVNSVTLNQILQFLQRVKLSVYQYDSIQMHQIYEKSMSELAPDSNHQFLREYSKNLIFDNLRKNPSWMSISNLEQYLSYHKMTVDKYSNSPFFDRNLEFEVDSPGLKKYLTEVTVSMDQSKPIPIARFETSDSRYACNQIMNSLDEVSSTDVYFIRIANIIDDINFVKAALTRPSSVLVRSLCFIGSSDSHSNADPKQLQQTLTDLAALLHDTVNRANVRVIFIMENHKSAVKTPTLLTLVENTVLKSRSAQLFSIKDGSYTLTFHSFENVMDGFSIELNGKHNNLRALYGRRQPRQKTFNPGQLLFDFGKKKLIIGGKPQAIEKQCPGGVYIDRKFPTWPSQESQPSSYATDTPSAIAYKISLDTLNFKEPIINALNGEAGSGKSIALKKILSELQARTPNSWSVLVDLPKIFPPSISGDAVTVDQTVKKVIDPKLQDLFKNVLEVNPQQIVFVFDGVDQMTGNREKNSLEMINSLSKKGTHVVLAGNLRTTELLHTNPDVKMLVYQIQEMSSIETKQLLTNIWYEKIITSPSTSSTVPSENRLTNFVTNFMEKLTQTSFPKTPLALKILSEAFSKQCYNFVIGRTMKFDIPASNIEAVANKYHLFEQFSANLNTEKTNVHDVYGPLTFKRVVESVEPSDTAKKILMPFQSDMINAEKALQSGSQTTETPALFDFRHNTDILSHQDMENFFAAKYVANLLLNNNKQDTVDKLKSLLMKQDYNHMLTYVNADLDGKNFENSVFKSSIANEEPTMILKIMENIIDAGFDNLHSMLYNMLTPNQRNEFTDFYRNSEIEFYKPTRTFGKLSLREYVQLNMFEVLPSKIKCTRMCVLVEKSMVKSLKQLQTSNVWFESNPIQPNAIYENMLDISVTRPKPNLELVKFLIEKSPMLKIDYNSLLIRTISNTGDNCRPIVYYLMEKGANPQIATTPDGLTPLLGAVKWNKNVVKFVIEDLHVPPKAGLRVFNAALDANPSPYLTSGDWWDMMSYLVGRIEIPDQTIGQISLRAPGKQPASRMFRSLITDLNNVDNKLIQVSGLSDGETTRLIRYVTWNLHPDTLSLRRMSVLKTIIGASPSVTRASALELLVHYRGIGPMLPTSRRHYEEAIGDLFDSFTTPEPQARTQLRARVRDFLIDNINDGQDLLSIKSFTEDGLVMNADERFTMLQRLDRRLYLSVPPENHVPSISIEQSLAIPRLTYDPFINRFSMNAEYESLRTAIMQPRVQELMRQAEQTQVGKLKTLSFIRCLTGTPAGCRITWEIVDLFNVGSDRRSISNIRINTERFLNTLRTTRRSQNGETIIQQLLGLCRELTELPSGTSRLFTGNSRMMIRDIMQSGDLNNQRRNYLTTASVDDIINPPTESSRPVPNRVVDGVSKYRYRSQTAILRMATGLSIGRQIQATVAACGQYLLAKDQADIASCALSGGGVIKSLVVDVLGEVVTYLLPATITIISHNLLRALPKSFLSNSIRGFAFEFLTTLKVKTAANAQKISKVAKGTFAAIGIIFDAYIIGNTIKSLVDCYQTSSCTSRDKAELIISMSFAAISLTLTIVACLTGALVALPLIALVLTVIESIAQGLNNLIYYAVNYGIDFWEGLEIFYSTFYLIPISSKFKRLEAHSEHMKQLEKVVVDYLNDCDETIVAMAIGVGSLDKTWEPGWAIINMSRMDDEFTRRLSRVQPEAPSNITRWCLPATDPSEAYERRHEQTISSAKYLCKNAFVFAHKARANSGDAKKLHVLFNLMNINRGYVYGSTVYNNMFLVFNGSKEYSIVAYTELVSNVFYIQGNFQGSIYLKGKANFPTTIDFSKLKSINQVTWNFTDNMGYVTMSRGVQNSFWIVRQNSTEPNLIFVGGTGTKDVFVCDYHKYYKNAVHDKFIAVDGGGGRMWTEEDGIHDCQSTVARPWTKIIGSLYPDITYTVHVNINVSKQKRKLESTATTRIRPLNSRFMVIVDGFFFMSYTINVVFTPVTNILNWEFWHTDTTSLNLQIEPYVKSQTTPIDEKSDSDRRNINEIHTVIIDQATSTTIYPVIDFNVNSTDPIIVDQFSVFKMINTTDLVDVYEHYNEIDYYSTIPTNYSITTKFTDSLSGKTFTFGSKLDERFLIDGNSSLFVGFNGSDTYVYSKLSPDCVYIDNKAQDLVLDALIIVEDTCDLLTTIPKPINHICQGGNRDLILQCTHKDRQSAKYVVLISYSDGPLWKHLDIYWNNKTYIPLPPTWTGGQDEVIDPNFYNLSKLAVYFSLEKDMMGYLLVVTPKDPFIFVKVFESNNPITAFRSGATDVIVSKKYLENPESPSGILLKNFIHNETSNSLLVAEGYENLRLIFADDRDDDLEKKVWSSANIFLVLSSGHSISNGKLDSDLIQEFLVDMTLPAVKEEKIIINRLMSSDNNDYRVGILTVVGAKPQDLTLRWNITMDGSSPLVLCAFGRCIFIENWCSADFYRLDKLAFMGEFYQQPLLIENLRELDCQISKDHVLQELKQKLNRAQARLELTEKIGYSDTARAKRCLGLAFSEHFDDEAIYRIFGFSSMLEEKKFMVENCDEVLTADLVNPISYGNMTEMLNDSIKIFNFSDFKATEQELKVISDIENNFKLFESCWESFKNSFYATKSTEPGKWSVLEAKLYWQRYREILYRQCLEKN